MTAHVSLVKTMNEQQYFPSNLTSFPELITKQLKLCYLSHFYGQLSKTCTNFVNDYIFIQFATTNNYAFESWCIEIKKDKASLELLISISLNTSAITESLQVSFCGHNVWHIYAQWQNAKNDSFSLSSFSSFSAISSVHSNLNCICWTYICYQICPRLYKIVHCGVNENWTVWSYIK